jgi:hypothetical protein
MFPVSTAEGEVCVEMPDLHGRRSLTPSPTLPNDR